MQSVLLGGILDLVCRLFVHRTVAECSLLTSVIILVSLCEPVAGDTQQALHCRCDTHIHQKKKKAGHLTHNATLKTATMSQTLETKYNFTALTNTVNPKIATLFKTDCQASFKKD